MNLRAWAARMNELEEGSFEEYLRGTASFAECAAKLIEGLRDDKGLCKHCEAEELDAECSHEDELKALERAHAEGYDVERAMMDRATG